jgi:hypothetical protein
MIQPSSPEPTLVLRELDLGQHSLIMRDDGSIDLIANDEHTPYLADNAMSLDRDETYRLFSALSEEFKHGAFSVESLASCSYHEASEQAISTSLVNVRRPWTAHTH